MKNFYLSPVRSKSVIDNSLCIFIIAVLALILSTLSAEVTAEEIVLADDGREVLLSDDGSWHYLSRERYATSKSGQRILLSPDGSWRLFEGGLKGNRSDFGDPKNSQHPSFSKPIASNSPDALQFLLNNVQVLKKKTKTHKSLRLSSQTVYTLNITNRGDKTINSLNALAQANQHKINARSSKNERFDVVQVSLKQEVLKAGETTELVVVTNGSPKWMSIQYLSIEFEPGFLHNQSKLQYRKDMDEVIVKSVKELK